MIINHKTVIFVFLCVAGMLTGLNTVYAENDELPMITGVNWTTAPEKSKLAWLHGAATIVEVEQEIQAKNSPAAQCNSFVPTLIGGLSGFTLTEIMENIDGFYDKNRDQLQKPVIHVVWDLAVANAQSN
jgi:hypothetical protein